MSLESRSVRVTTFGGGTGGPPTIEALNRTVEITGRDLTINAIAPMFDSGGRTGIDRANSHQLIPAVSDSKKEFLALPKVSERDTDAYKSAKEMLTWVDPRTGENIGHKILVASLDSVTGYAKFEGWFKSFGVDFNGHHVLPASTEPSNIVWTNEEGIVFEGEHHLDNNSMSKKKVKHMELKPPVKAFSEATDAVRNADVIIISPGSLYGSLLCNFLPEGMKEAMAESSAPLVFIVNLTTTASETRKLKPKDYIKLLTEYTGKKPNVIIAPEMTRKKFEKKYPKAARSYKRARSKFLNWKEKDYKIAREAGVEIILHKATEVVVEKRKPGYKKNPGYIRHNPEKLADSIAEIIPVVFK